MTEERDVLSAEEIAWMHEVCRAWPPSRSKRKWLAALDSHEALRACLDETRRERDEAQEKSSRRAELQQYALTEYAAAEAEVARLREALTKIEYRCSTRRIGGPQMDGSEKWASPFVKEVVTIARAALSAPASTPEDEPPLPGLGKFLGHVADRDAEHMPPVSTPNSQKEAGA